MTGPEHAPSPDADIDALLADQHSELAAQLAIAHNEILRGEAAPLETQQDLLRVARSALKGPHQ